MDVQIKHFINKLYKLHNICVLNHSSQSNESSNVSEKTTLFCLASSIIFRFCNLFMYLIVCLATLNLSIPLMLPNVEFVYACVYF